MSSKKKAVDEIFNPDINGYSEWVTRETISNNKSLNWGNNGIGRHNIYFNDNRFLWEKYPATGSIQKLRTVGFNYNKLYGASRPIRKDISDYYKSMKCVHCDTSSNIIPDHKNDLYNDPRVLNIHTQTYDDFQSLCTSCNAKKRQVSKKTKELNKRIGATTIGSISHFKINFISGTDYLDLNDINAMRGTYWYDCPLFKKIALQICCEKEKMKIVFNELLKTVKRIEQKQIYKLVHKFNKQRNKYTYKFVKIT